MLKQWMITGLIALSVTHYAYAAEVQTAGDRPSGVALSERYSDSDWDLLCDNTLTCRAVGYSAEDVNPAASVLLTRQAGPGTSVSNRVILAEEMGQPAAGRPSLRIDTRSRGKLVDMAGADGVDDEIWMMDPVQFSAFTDALRNGKTIVFYTDRQEYPLSSHGGAAVLLKMDETQGRFDTPSALIRKGSASESEVNASIPLPVVTRVTPQENELREMTGQEASDYGRELLSYITGNSRCQKAQISEPWRIARLDDKYTLVSVGCWQSANDAGDAMFVIRNDKKTPPVLITDNATWYEEGEIGILLKGSNSGDCLSSAQYVWNGQTFVLRDSSESGRCRMLRLDGAWHLPSYEAEVINPR